MIFKSFLLAILLCAASTYYFLLHDEQSPLQKSATLLCSPLKAPPRNHSGAPRRHQRCPDYFKWIHRDLEPWRESGITRYSIYQAASKGSMRITISKNNLYVQFHGRCPQSRSLFTLWGLLMLLDKFRVPDVDFVINCKDKPVLGSALLPIFSYCTTNRSSDIPFPDYSFWGWPEVNIQPWQRERNEIIAGSSKTDWNQRQPVAYWKGNSRMGRMRGHLFQCNLSRALISEQNWFLESQSKFTNSKLSNQCNQRFNIYVEGAAWSASLKYKLACGSTVLKLESDYDEFFSRALVANTHFVPVSGDRICGDISGAVEWGNSNPAEAEEIGVKGQEFTRDELSMQRVYDYMYHLLTQYAKLQRFVPRVPRGAQLICKSAVERVLTQSEALHFLGRLEVEDRNANPCVMTH